MTDTDYTIKHRVTQKGMLPDSHITFKTEGEGDQQRSIIKLSLGDHTTIEAETDEGDIEINIKGNFEITTFLELMSRIAK